MTEDIYIACLNYDLAKVKEGLDIISRQSVDIYTNVYRGIATLAAEKGHPYIFELYLNMGTQFDPLLDRATEKGFYQDHQMLVVLSKAKWRNLETAKGDPSAVK
jgi:hypothetical protein